MDISQYFHGNYMTKAGQVAKTECREAGFCSKAFMSAIIKLITVSVSLCSHSDVPIIAVHCGSPKKNKDLQRHH